ncbi:MAG: DUF92 domain-containing protein [Clostridia bacterium]|nr:DUF92 domain-containing protein [Clostridia bacterium]
MEYVIVGAVAGALTAFLTVKVKALTLPAALLAVVIILCSCVFGGWFGLTLLLSAYLTIAVVDRALKERTSSVFKSINKKSGPRDIVQVAANGIPATVCIVLYGITEERAFLVGFSVALTEALADSIASDVGVLSKSEPVSICRFKRISRGLSGGVSFLGTASSFAATVLCALLYFVFFKNMGEALAVLAFGNLGCLADSIIGDLLQEKLTCKKCGALTEKPVHCDTETVHASGIPGLDNCAVNLLSNTFAAGASVLLLIW